MIAAEMSGKTFPNPGEERPAKWPDRFVRDPEHRRTVKLWIYCEANGESFRAACRGRNLPYSTALRHRTAAIQRITMLLNLEQSLENDSNMVA